MGDRDNGNKRKVGKHFEVGESSEQGARRTRARTERTHGGGDPSAYASLAWINRRDGRNDMWMWAGQQQPAAEGGGEEGSRARGETLDLISQIGRHPALPSGVSDQHPRPQAPSSSRRRTRASRQNPVEPLFPRAHISDFQPPKRVRGSTAVANHHGRRTRQQHGVAQGGHTFRHGARLHGIQEQARASAPASQPVAATGASGSGEPQHLGNAGVAVQCPACHNHPYTACLLCTNAPNRLGVDPHQAHHPPRLAPPQQQHRPPPLPTAAAELVGGLLMGPQLGYASRMSAFQPWRPGLQGPPPPPQAHPVPRADHPAPAFVLYQPVLVPEDRRCPACRFSPGRIAVHPPQHVCICDFCRVFGVVCQVCAAAQAAAWDAWQGRL